MRAARVPRCLEGEEVCLAVGRSHVHQAGALVDGDVLRFDYAEGATIPLLAEVVERGLIRHTE